MDLVVLWSRSQLGSKALVLQSNVGQGFTPEKPDAPLRNPMHVSMCDTLWTEAWVLSNTEKVSESLPSFWFTFNVWIKGQELKSVPGRWRLQSLCNVSPFQRKVRGSLAASMLCCALQKLSMLSKRCT